MCLDITIFADPTSEHILSGESDTSMLPSDDTIRNDC